MVDPKTQLEEGRELFILPLLVLGTKGDKSWVINRIHATLTIKGGVDPVLQKDLL